VKIRREIRDALEEALKSLGMGDAGAAVLLERPRDPSHGDMSSPVAMGLAKKLRRNPLEIADEIVSKLSLPSDLVESVEVLKPGFINFRFAIEVLRRNLAEVMELDNAYGSSDIGHGVKIQCEYVSANPTGPLVVVSARAAAVGSVLVNLLNFEGFEAHGEYYVNDYGKQVEALGSSLRYRLRERFEQLEEGEELGDYPGPYMKRLAEDMESKQAQVWLREGESLATFGAYAADHLLSQIRRDMESYGVRFHSFFRESTLHPAATRAMLERFVAGDHTYEKDGALYFRSTVYGDEKDRVLRKSDGEDTYFLSDIAYHNSKLERGYMKVIGLLGPDHHGHVARMKAATQVLGAHPDWLEVMIVGWVRLMEDGKPLSMSKRAGEYITMRELIKDVGTDVAKYFFLMRRANSPLDFDLTLARKQSDENPVYYVQYAHARISSVIRFARENGIERDHADVDLTRLEKASERALMLQILYFPHVVEGATAAREPHRLTTYAGEVATAFHAFYHECRIVDDDEALSSARLVLAISTMQVLRTTLRLLGVTAPASM